MQTTLQGAIALKDNTNLFEKDGKIWANINWLRLWPKNPRVIDKKNLKKLENQIKELGIYKPLVVTPDGEILGGNQRFKVIQELSKTDERYKWVWVSPVEAWTDEERLKYAISDNFSAGEYTREKLKEVLNIEQGKLFNDYDIEFSNKQSINEFIDNFYKEEDEIKCEELTTTLKKSGVAEDVIQDIIEMSNYKKSEKFDKDFTDESIVGTGCYQFKDKKIFSIKLIFAEENEDIYKKLLSYFEEGNKFIKEHKKDIYQELVKVYGNHTGNVLAKSLNLINQLTKNYENTK